MSPGNSWYLGTRGAVVGSGVFITNHFYGIGSVYIYIYIFIFIYIYTYLYIYIHCTYIDYNFI